jgi:hypothetical protein
MPRIAHLACLALLPLSLSACDVSVQDQTPAEVTANDRLGMYPIKAEITRDTLVTPDALYVTALVNNQPLPLAADSAGGEWEAMYPLRCHDSFTLQYRVAWTVQGLASRIKLIPEKPKTVRLLEPPLVKEVKVDTSARSRKGWEGVVEYAFLTEPNTQISSLRIEPLSNQPQDVEAAAPISVITPAPVSATCGMPVDITLASKSQHARGYLVIDTNNPSMPHWRTEVDFAPGNGVERTG